MREWGQLRHNDHSLWWSVLSRNKRSVALNLREPRGQQIAAELCAGADVIVENFRPGTMERWGIGPEQVHAVNPGCIYARVSGYGQSGSYRDRAGFAAGGEAISRPPLHQRLPRSGAAALGHLAWATRWRPSRRSRGS